MAIIYKNMDTNRSTSNPTVAIGWMKSGYRVIVIAE